MRNDPFVKSVRFLLEQHIAYKGHRTTTANSGEEAAVLLDEVDAEVTKFDEYQRERKGPTEPEPAPSIPTPTPAPESE